MTRYDPGMQGTFAWQGIPITEDLTRVDGIIAGCGEAALLVILNGLKGLPTDPDELGMIIRNAEAHGWVGKGGVSAPSGLKSIAGSYGVSLQSGNLNDLINQWAGKRPIIVGVSNARAFGGRDSGVFGHYVTIVGRTAGGALIVNDPNQSSKFGYFDVYTQQQFSDAHPFWAAVPTTWSGGGGTGGGSGDPCGPKPDPSKYQPLGVTDPRYLAAMTAWTACELGQGGVNPLGGAAGLLGIKWPDWFTNIGQWITGPNTWFNAQRILKLVAGTVLIFIAFQGLIGGMGASIVSGVAGTPAGQVVTTAVPGAKPVVSAAKVAS